METCNSCDSPDFETEDLIVNAKEHKLLKKFKRKLEGRYNIEIRMPKAKSLDSDVIFVSLHGQKLNRDKVKKILSAKMNVPAQTSHEKGGALLITLSDSEEESSSTEPKDESVIELFPANSPKLESALTFCHSQDDSVCIIESPLHSDINKVSRQQSQRKKRKYSKSIRNEEVRSKAVLQASDAEASELCEVTSTTDEMVSKKANLMSVIEDPAARIELPAVDFIPLSGESKSKNTGKSINKLSHLKVKTSEINNDDIIVIDDPVDQPEVPRRLRPIVIDGSNIARTHGKITSTFSCKGIKVAIDYFLARGHTQVTAFVPKFRRNPNPNRKIPTTDAEILDELEKKQHVVFTPSGRVNGKCFSSYDDRFVVKLASSNGGVIVSNDKYEDLMNENESFKEAIQERLLQYCIVGDHFMPPDDPLGRNGPTLDDYLSFPPDSKET